MKLANIIGSVVGGGVALITLVTADIAQAVTFNGSTYSLTTTTTWTNAQAQAQAAGGSLVTVNDINEHNFLLSAFGTTESFWIGFTDQDEEGVFEWISEEPVIFKNWVLSEPNNYDGSEDYTAMNQHTAGGWNDLNGQNVLRGIIEVKTTSVPEPSSTLTFLVVGALGGGSLLKRRRQ
ncbi:lectin-like protein [Mastigocladopsis repens]|uniref:lectin-like protein n=1 Tax=Mastigocladopsis repens TaxID=221287 RepID=UPI000305CAC5|nr:lectin-like protein [Mastigocladopsis repens]